VPRSFIGPMLLSAFTWPLLALGSVMGLWTTGLRVQLLSALPSPSSVRELKRVDEGSQKCAGRVGMYVSHLPLSQSQSLVRTSDREVHTLDHDESISPLVLARKDPPEHVCFPTRYVPLPFLIFLVLMMGSSASCGRVVDCSKGTQDEERPRISCRSTRRFGDPYFLSSRAEVGVDGVVVTFRVGELDEWEFQTEGVGGRRERGGCWEYW
jgi:hypothetical protein